MYLQYTTALLLVIDMERKIMGHHLNVSCSNSPILGRKSHLQLLPGMVILPSPVTPCRTVQLVQHQLMDVVAIACMGGCFLTATSVGKIMMQGILLELTSLQSFQTILHN